MLVPVHQRTPRAPNTPNTPSTPSSQTDIYFIDVSESHYKLIFVIELEFIIPFWCETLVNTPSKHDVDPMLVLFWLTIRDTGPATNQHWFNALYLLGSSWSGIAYCWQRLQADTSPMSVKCWASVASAGQYPFSLCQYFILPVP